MIPVFKVIFNELAEREFVNSFQYYEEQQVGLGQKFESELAKILSKISKNPFLFQRKFKHYREAPLEKFPYFMVYEIFEKKVIINSIFHTSRNPKTKLKKQK